MRAVVVREWTDPKDLKVDSLPSRDPGAGEVRIAVRAAGLNFADTLIVAGKYQEKPPFPFSPGMEASGAIEAVGSGVTGLKEGDRVMALTGHGGFAERCVVEARRVLKIPDSMSFTDAAAFPGRLRHLASGATPSRPPAAGRNAAGPRRGRRRRAHRRPDRKGARRTRDRHRPGRRKTRHCRGQRR